MTRREQTLSWVFLGTILLTGSLWLGQAYLDRLANLDSRFATLRKEAVRLQGQLTQRSKTNSLIAVQVNRFWPAGTLPEPVSLAASIKKVLDSTSITIQDFQVISSTSQDFRLRYTLEAGAGDAVQALLRLCEDPKLFVHRFSATLKDQNKYRFIWEVGYAAFP